MKGNHGSTATVKHSITAEDMTMKRSCVIVAAALGALLATAPGARAADTDCNTTYSTFQTINGNLSVPDNATCSFAAGASVTGNVKVGHNATLIMQGGQSPATSTATIAALWPWFSSPLARTSTLGIAAGVPAFHMPASSN